MLRVLSEDDEELVKSLAVNTFKRLRKYGDSLYVDPGDPRLIPLKLWKWKSPFKDVIESVSIRRRYWYTYIVREQLEAILGSPNIVDGLKNYLGKKEIIEKTKVNVDSTEQKIDIIKKGNLRELCIMEYDYEFHTSLDCYRDKIIHDSEAEEKLRKKILEHVKSEYNLSEDFRSRSICDPALLFWALQLWIENFDKFNLIAQSHNMVLLEVFEKFKKKYIKETSSGCYLEFFKNGGQVDPAVSVTPEIMKSMRSTLYLTLDLLQIVNQLEKMENTSNSNLPQLSKIKLMASEIIEKSLSWLKANKGEIIESPVFSSIFCRILVFYYNVVKKVDVASQVSAILMEEYKMFQSKKERLKITIRKSREHLLIRVLVSIILAVLALLTLILKS